MDGVKRIGAGFFMYRAGWAFLPFVLAAVDERGFIAFSFAAGERWTNMRARLGSSGPTAFCQRSGAR
jgi:hypothetical protein